MCRGRVGSKGKGARLLGSLIVLCFASTACAQSADPPRTFYVDAAHAGVQEGSQRNPYRSIAAALNASVPGRGDTVLVRPGTYAEVLSVPEGTTLTSELGAMRTQISGNRATAADLVTLGQASILRGFTIGPTGGAAVRVPTGFSATVLNCVLYASAIGLSAEPNTLLEAVNNTFVQNATGLRAAGGAVADPVKNNAIVQNGTGISVVSGAKLALSYNAYHDNGVAVEGIFPGDTDLVSNPLFVNAAALNFHLRAPSNLRNAGDPAAAFNDRDGTRNDIGSDGGPDGTLDTLAPQILVTTTPANLRGNAPLAVLFNAGASLDEWGIASYEWDFDALDGISVEGFGAVAPVLYDSPGGYLVTLRVTDNSGLTSTANLRVQAGQPPSLAIDAQPRIGALPLSVQFSVQTDADPGALLFDWDLDGDGFFDSAEEAPRFRYQPQNYVPGLYPVLLSVRDAAQVSAQQITYLTLSAFAPLRSTHFAAGQAGQLAVNGTGTAADGLVLSVPANAFTLPMTVGLAPLSAGDLPLEPSGEVLARIHFAPVNVSFARAVGVLVPLAAEPARELRVLRFDEARARWTSDGIQNIRIVSSPNPAAAFETTQFGSFAVVLTGEDEIKAQCGCAPGPQPARAQASDLFVVLAVLSMLLLARCCGRPIRAATQKPHRDRAV